MISGLIDGFIVAADGSVTIVSPGQDDPSQIVIPEDGYAWFHFDMDQASTWLPQSGMIDSFAAKALFASETRPRLVMEKHGVLMNLRGVNLNPEKNPEDMLSVRALLQPNRLVTVRRQRSLAIEKIRERCRAGDAPSSAPKLLLSIITGLTERIEPVVDRIADRIDELEIEAAAGHALSLADEVAEIRHDALVFRRYMNPQHEAIKQFAGLGAPWISPDMTDSVQEQADRMQRIVEEVEITRDRSSILNDQVSAQRADRMNRNMMIISVASAVFLPLGFLTGLLGINVAGMPGANWEPAFTVVAISCAVIASVLLLAMRAKDWF